MPGARGRLLNASEFATTVGVTRAQLLGRLNGPERDFWRATLDVLVRRGEILIPETSVAVWHTAEPPTDRHGSRRRAYGSKARIVLPEMNQLLMRLSRRAEIEDRTVLRDTFVNVGQLSHLLSSPNHQVVFGRRGTGKTHALSLLAANVAEDGDIAISIDLRRVGSTGAYQSKSTPIEQRCTQLLVDLLAAIHGVLVDVALVRDDVAPGLYACLDQLAEMMTTVEVVGSVEVQHASSDSHADDRSSGVSLDLGASPGVSASRGRTFSTATVFERRITESGAPLLDISFGDIARVMERVLDELDGPRIWIMLDEWSSLPIELQPILADFIRRALLAVPGVIVKIAAIEDRSYFRISTPGGDHVGLELGADVMADITLDDFMIFSNDSDRALDFFSTMLMRHVLPHLGESATIRSPGEFVGAAFVDWNAFRELVRAAEGVPRDAINVTALAASKADRRRIGVGDVRAAARDWYHRDKEGALKHPAARSLLAAIIDEIVGNRKTRSFLLERGGGGSEDYVIRELYDARVLHIIRRGVAPADRPSLRFDGFVIDYGCYVDFSVAFDRASQFWISEVPPDRFTLIKGSVLDLKDLR